MSEIEIGLGAVVQHVNFTVLERCHQSRIDIEIGIELLQNDPQTARFQQCPEGSSRQAVAYRTDYAASDENVFHRETPRRFARASFCSSAFVSAGVSTPGDPCFVTST